MKKLIAVAGPTASGKSGLAVALAKALDGEIISCDSMQMYEGLDIATAKITVAEMQGVPHHLLGVIPRERAFSAADYVRLAGEKVQEITARGRLPIVAGGTGLYLRTLLYGVQFHQESRSDTLRRDLEQQWTATGIDPLYVQLQILDRAAAEKIHPNNTQRVIRALEYCLVTGEQFSQQSIMAQPQYDFYLFGLSCRNRALLYSRIEQRVDAMLQKGLVAEAQQALVMGQDGITAAQAIGCKELAPYFFGQISLEQAVENIKQETRRYAKRQLTWLHKEKKVHWLFTEDYKDTQALYSQALQQAAVFLLEKGEGA